MNMRVVAEESCVQTYHEVVLHHPDDTRLDGEMIHFGSDTSNALDHAFTAPCVVVVSYPNLQELLWTAQSEGLMARAVRVLGRQH